MTRWIWKRWVWAGVFGVSAAVGLALGAGKDAPSGPPKVGDVITLKFEKGSEKQVKILKTEKQPDGSYLSEVKDMKSGEVFSLLDQTTKGPATGKAAAKVPETKSPTKQPETKISIKQPEKLPETKTSIKQPDAVKIADPAAKAKAPTRPADPLLPQVNASVPGPIKDPKLTGNKPPTAMAAPAPMPEPTPERKQG